MKSLLVKDTTVSERAKIVREALGADGECEDIDLVLWLVGFFIEFPYPWNILYEVVSNGFFALWLARIWFVRDRYFQIIEHKTVNKE